MIWPPSLMRLRIRPATKIRFMATALPDLAIAVDNWSGITADTPDINHNSHCILA